MSITEFSQEMTAAAADFNDNLPCDIKSENTQQTTAMLTTQNALTWEIVPNIIKIKHEHELPTARKMHDEMMRKLAKLEIDVKRLRNESKDLKSKLEKKTKDLEIAEQDAMIWKTCCSNSQFNKTVDLQELHDQIKAQLRAEQKEIKSQYKKKIKDFLLQRMKLAKKDRDSKNKITLVKALRRLENLGEKERAHHAASLAEAELTCIRDEMTDSLKSEQIEYNRTHISTIYNRQTHL